MPSVESGDLQDATHPELESYLSKKGFTAEAILDHIRAGQAEAVEQRSEAGVYFREGGDDWPPIH